MRIEILEIRFPLLWGEKVKKLLHIISAGNEYYYTISL